MLNRRNKIVIILLAIAAVVLVQLACEGVSASDPQLLPGFFDVLKPVFDLIGDLWSGSANENPPIIIQVTVDPATNLTTVEGLGKENANATIKLYKIELHGCQQDATKGDLLGETQVKEDRTWSIPVSLPERVVIAATQMIGGKESGISNLKISGVEQYITIDNKDKLEQEPIEIVTNGSPLPQPLTGTGISNTCLRIKNNDDGRILDGDSMNAFGTWSLQFPLSIGQNNLTLFTKEFPDEKVDLTLHTYHITLEWPYPNNISYKLTAWLGRNDFHWNEWGGFHDGIDIGAPFGSDVHSVAKGKVIYVQNDPHKCGGNMVFIDHGNWFSGYLHLNEIKISGLILPLKESVEVEAGDVIGTTGKTDCDPETPVHLHLSVYRWPKGDWAKSTESKYIYPVPKRAGFLIDPLININPPGNVQLNNSRNSTDQVRKCVAQIDYWNIEWSQIPIYPYPLKDGNWGTNFNSWGGSDLCLNP